MVNGRVDEVFFCPQEGEKIEAILIDLIKSSKKIYGALYLLNREPIVDAFIEAHKNGTSVNLVVDKSALNGGTNHIYKLLRTEGFSLYVHNVQARFGPIMHNKFLVFEDVLGGRRVVASGSMNLTYSGLFKNSENVTFRDSPLITTKFLARAVEILSSADNLTVTPGMQKNLPVQDGEELEEEVRFD